MGKLTVTCSEVTYKTSITKVHLCAVYMLKIEIITDGERDGRVSIELRHKYVLMSLILMYISHLERNEVIMDTVLLVITKNGNI